MTLYISQVAPTPFMVSHIAKTHTLTESKNKNKKQSAFCSVLLFIFNFQCNFLFLFILYGFWGWRSTSASYVSGTSLMGGRWGVTWGLTWWTYRSRTSRHRRFNSASRPSHRPRSRTTSSTRVVVVFPFPMGWGRTRSGASGSWILSSSTPGWWSSRTGRARPSPQGTRPGDDPGITSRLVPPRTRPQRKTWHSVSWCCLATGGSDKDSIMS